MNTRFFMDVVAEPSSGIAFSGVMGIVTAAVVAAVVAAAVAIVIRAVNKKNKGNKDS